MVDVLRDREVKLEWFREELEAAGIDVDSVKPLVDVLRDREVKLEWFREELEAAGIDVDSVKPLGDEQGAWVHVAYLEPQAEWGASGSHVVISGRYTSLMQSHLLHGCLWEPGPLEAVAYDPDARVACFWEMPAEWARKIVRGDISPGVAQDCIEQAASEPYEVSADGTLDVAALGDRASHEVRR